MRSCSNVWGISRRYDGFLLRCYERVGFCRKVAEVADGGKIPVWSDGTAVRSYTYVSDMVDGIYRLMHSGLEGPANIGDPEYVTVKALVELGA